MVKMGRFDLESFSMWRQYLTSRLPRLWRRAFSKYEGTNENITIWEKNFVVSYKITMRTQCKTEPVIFKLTRYLSAIYIPVISFFKIQRYKFVEIIMWLDTEWQSELTLENVGINNLILLELVTLVLFLPWLFTCCVYCNVNFVLISMLVSSLKTALARFSLH